MTVSYAALTQAPNYTHLIQTPAPRTYYDISMALSTVLSS